MDHYFQMEHLGGSAEPMLEGYTSLGFLAARTSRLELGLLVTGVTYRYPGLLAKIVTTLDVLSQGRAMLGLGAAWYEREHLALGVHYPPTKERVERLEETILVLRQMFGEDDGPFEGEHYRLAETINIPQVVRPGGPRLVIGGGGERKTLRLVAQYADATNLLPRRHARARSGRRRRVAGRHGGLCRHRHQPDVGRPGRHRPGRLDRADVRQQLIR
jgi:F420-dependent oxidoreductase-like protein